jgi:hypothetical protein
MKKVIEFPSKKKKKSLSIKEVEQIGFLTTTDRDLWITNPSDIQKIMLFIVREKIKILEDES